MVIRLYTIPYKQANFSMAKAYINIQTTIHTYRRSLEETTPLIGVLGVAPSYSDNFFRIRK